MFPTNPRVVLVLLAAVIGFYGLAFVQASAQQESAAQSDQAAMNAHPVSIHDGTCANPGQEAEFDVKSAKPIGDGDATDGSPVLAAEATIKTTLDDLTADDDPYAVLVNQADLDDGAFIACGDIGGPVEHGKLVVGLRPVNGSGVAGIAILDQGDEDTKVQVYLIDDVESLNTGASAPATGESANAVTIGVTEFSFQPNSITIPSNTPVTVTLTNNGAIGHDFSLKSHGNPNLPSDLAQDVDIDPGESKTITLNLPAGTYYFYCDVPGHEQNGMRGNIVAQDGAAIATAEATVPVPSGG